MRKWETLILLLEKHNADVPFVAECVYAYIVNYSLNHPRDNQLLKELAQFLEEVHQ